MNRKSFKDNISVLLETEFSDEVDRQLPIFDSGLEKDRLKTSKKKVLNCFASMVAADEPECREDKGPFIVTCDKFESNAKMEDSSIYVWNEISDRVIDFAYDPLHVQRIANTDFVNCKSLWIPSSDVSKVGESNVKDTVIGLNFEHEQSFCEDDSPHMKCVKNIWAVDILDLRSQSNSSPTMGKICEFSDEIQNDSTEWWDNISDAEIDFPDWLWCSNKDATLHDSKSTSLIGENYLGGSTSELKIQKSKALNESGCIGVKGDTLSEIVNCPVSSISKTIGDSSRGSLFIDRQRSKVVSVVDSLRKILKDPI